MTLNTTYSPTVADGNGVTKSFSYSFNPISENYLKVSLEQNGEWVEQVSGWTATVSENGGVVTFDTAPTTRVAIERDVPEEQPTSYKTSSGFQAQVIEHSFDMLTGMVQELKEKSDRSVAVDVGSSVNPQEVVAQVERVYSSIDNVDTVADNITNVNTIANNVTKVYLVANNISDVTAVGNNITKVSAVSADLTNIDAVNANKTNIDKVAAIDSDVTAVAGIKDDVTAVNTNKTNINKVASDINRVNLVADDIDSVHTVAVDISNIIDVAGNKTNIDTVAGSISNVNNVGASITSVNSVAGDLTNIDAVNNNKTNIDTVATNIVNVNLVGADINKVADVADDLTNIDAVNANKTNIDKVASIKNDVTTVAGIQGDVMAVAADASMLQAVHSDLSNIDAVALDKINIDAVATNIADVNTVASHSTSVDTVATNIGAVTTAANNISAINDAPTYAAQAKQWAIGVPGEPTGGSAKYWAERAEDAASGLGDPANRDLSNLTSAGQAVIETADGTISNHIKEIPQNIKLTLENNVVTLKAGSVVLRGGEVYTTYTLTEDKSLTISSSLENGRYFLFTNNTGTPLVIIQNRFGSGTTIPEDSSTYGRFFITTNKTFYNWSGAQNAWVESGVTYPIAMVDVNNGVASFAKDSNGNDMIFNGAGFVGHHAFVYPGVKVLRPNEFNSDGSFRSINTTLNSLLIFEMTSTLNAITINGTTTGSTRKYFEVEKLDTSLQGFQYVKSENVDYFWNGAEYLKRNETKVADFTISGTTVTDFTIRQPVRLATTEMTDKIQSQVDTNTTAISGKQDTLVSGTNIKTINSTSVLGSGNFTLADQSLSNLNSDGQMIVDSQNGTISNCVLEIPQDLKLEISGGVITLKAGSVITLAQSTYATITTTVDKTYNASLSSNSTYFLFIDSSGMYLSLFAVDTAVSGATDSLAGQAYHTWFDTTNKVISRYSSDASTPSSTLAYPLCVIIKDSNGVRFAKDSNGNDMVFNGAGFIGHHAFVYPNVKALITHGIDTDGSLNSLKFISNKLTIFELDTLNNTLLCNRFSTNFYLNKVGIDLNSIDDLQDTYNWHYIKTLNMFYKRTTELQTDNMCPFVKYAYNGTTVTDFTIRQPVRTATVEMLDKKQNDITTITGYDATKTQTLKNVSGTLTWVDD